MSLERPGDRRRETHKSAGGADGTSETAKTEGEAVSRYPTLPRRQHEQEHWNSERFWRSGGTDSIARWSLSTLLTFTHMVRLIRRNELGCDEVAQTINALGIAVLHQERRARPILRRRELDHLAQA